MQNKSIEKDILHQFGTLIRELQPNPQEESYSPRASQYLMRMAVLSQQPSLSCKNAAILNDQVNGIARHFLSLAARLPQDSAVRENMIGLGHIVAMTESDYRCAGE